MWLLGFYLGDGFRAGNSKKLEKGYTKIELAIPEKEKELRDEVARIAKNIFDYKLLTSGKDRVTLNSRLFVKWFEDLGFSGLARTKTIPDWVFSLPVEQRLAFIGGYFDADGGVRSGRNNGLVFTSVSVSLLEKLKLLAISCGLNVSHIWEFSSVQRYKNDNRVRTGLRLMISGDIKKVRSRLKRKLDLFQDRKFVHRFQTAKGTTFKSHTTKYLGFVKILSIEKLGEEKIFDIEVDGHHNFVANGLLVHNSEVIYGSLRKNLEDKGVVFLGMDEGLKKYP
jgi:Fe-S cluster assembly protein SufB